MLSCVLLALFLLSLVEAQPHDAATAFAMSEARAQQLQRLASDWEPELYAELGERVPKFLPGLKSPCVAAAGGGQHCVPGAFLLGNWQSNTKGLGGLLGLHPNISSAANERCWGRHSNDKGGRLWLRQRPPDGFDPKRQVLAAFGCVTSLLFYPGFANRFHKFWEVAYWPCKASCMHNKTCARHYFEPTGQMWPCKAKALAFHDRATHLSATAAEPALNVTPPYLMRAFYGARVRLVAILRNPTDRLRHAYYAHPHYARKYGSGGEGLSAYVAEQTSGWQACEATYGARRCAVFFEQLGPQPNDVFFHCDQIIRGIYSPFVSDWLSAFPEENLMLIRAEDFLSAPSVTLRRVWRHIGVRPLRWAEDEASGGGATTTADAAAAIDPQPRGMRRAWARLPRSYREWTQAKGPMPAEAAKRLNALYAPYNRALRDLLQASAGGGGPSCGAAAGAEGGPASCDAFLWREEVA